MQQIVRAFPLETWAAALPKTAYPGSRLISNVNWHTLPSSSGCILLNMNKKTVVIVFWSAEEVSVKGANPEDKTLVLFRPDAYVSSYRELPASEEPLPGYFALAFKIASILIGADSPRTGVVEPHVVKWCNSICKNYSKLVSAMASAVVEAS